MYKLLVPLRYLRRNWLNVVAVAAVAIGVVVLICVLSVMKGFSLELRERFRATLSDLIIENVSGPFSGSEQIMARAEELPEVVSCAPEYEGLALINVQGVQRWGMFRGIDLDRELRTTDLADYWRLARGSQAREKISDTLQTQSGLGMLSTADVRQLLSQMRPTDFELLTPTEKKELSTWATQHDVDMQSLFPQALTAVPEWAAVEFETQLPCIPGMELVYPLHVGQTFTITTTRGSFDDERVIRTARISGFFRSGMSDYDSHTFYVPIAKVQKFMNQPGKVTSIAIRLDSYSNAPRVRATLLGMLTPDEVEQGLRLVRPLAGPSEQESIRQMEAAVKENRKLQEIATFQGTTPDTSLLTEQLKGLMTRVAASPARTDAKSLQKVQDFIRTVSERQDKALNAGASVRAKPFRISTWEDKRRNLLRAVWVERRLMAFILFFVILIAGFLVLSVLHTTVIAKTKDIGTLRALGATVQGIMSMFLAKGLLIGAIGSALGTTAGVLITRNLNGIEELLARVVGFRLFPRDIYMFDRIPTDPNPFWSIFTICSVTILVSLLASAYPAWKASRLDPVEALRYE